MEPPWDVGNENLFKCSRSHDHAHINYGENFKNLSLRNQEADDFETWYIASGTRVLPIFHMITLGWPWLFLWQGQICFRMLLHGWKLTQHWVLMYFQACSNSTYPQHSDERYRTNGPLVLTLLQLDFGKSGNMVLNNFYFCTKQKRYGHGKTSGRFLI